MSCPVELRVDNIENLFVSPTGCLPPTETRQCCELVEGSYVFDRSHGEHDQEPRRLRRVPRHRHSEGKFRATPSLIFRVVPDPVRTQRVAFVAPKFMFLQRWPLQNMEDLLEHNSDLSAKLMQIGDSIVYKLVQWTKRLPFYLELPVEVSLDNTVLVLR